MTLLASWIHIIQGTLILKARKNWLDCVKKKALNDLFVNIMTKFAVRDKKIFIFGGGEQWRPHIHVKDVSKAFIRVLESPIEKVKWEVFNVGSNDLNFQVKDIANKVASIVKDVKIDYAPSDPDARDYNINFDKISNVLGYSADFSVEEGIK